MIHILWNSSFAGLRCLPDSGANNNFEEVKNQALCLLFNLIGDALAYRNVTGKSYLFNLNQLSSTTHCTASMSSCSIMICCARACMLANCF